MTAVETIRSVGITAIEAAGAANARDQKEGHLKQIFDTISYATTNLDDVGDISLILPIPSNAILSSLVLYNTAMDSNGSPTLAANVGLAYSAIGGDQVRNGHKSGDSISANCLGAAITTLQSANTTGVNIRFQTDTVDNIGNPLWKIGGLSSDPGGLFYIRIALTAVAATAVAGKLTVKADFIRV